MIAFDARRSQPLRDGVESFQVFLSRSFLVAFVLNFPRFLQVGNLFNCCCAFDKMVMSRHVGDEIAKCRFVVFPGRLPHLLPHYGTSSLASAQTLPEP